MTDDASPVLTPVELYLMLVLAEGPSYGYAIMKRVEAHSDGAVRPDIGALYRVLAKLSEADWVVEAEAPEQSPEVHPGRTRRYYRLTSEGRAALRSEIARLHTVVELAARHDLVPGLGRS